MNKGAVMKGMRSVRQDESREDQVEKEPNLLHDRPGIFGFVQ